MNFNKFYLLTFVTVLLLITGCKTKKTDDETIIPVNTLYETGVNFLQQKKYDKAATEFEKIFFQHPGSSLTPQAELMQAYSLYLEGQYDQAIDVLDIFIKLHPRHEDIAYAYYLKAISNYTQISDVKLDQSRTRYAKEDFEEVITRFPATKYAIDSALKIDLVNDRLAGGEMMVGRYYLKKRNPIAAMSRFQTVIDLYDTTSHAEEALYRLVEANVMLGLTDEAQKYAATLGHNYPSGEWYKKAYILLK
jgi:outer membrane protein assembly factor BamD